MVYLSKKDAEKVINELSKINKWEITEIIEKMRSHKKVVYARSQPKIKRLLKQAFKEKRKVKINYYSLSSDEVTNRIVDVYKMHNDCIIAFCHLREEERTFVIDRINQAALLDDKYKIPKGWTPESIILDSS